ncbi:MAG: ABC1 kinase family protein [Sporichthyaceae bacterium]
MRAVPPLPDLDALARESAWVGARAGLGAEFEALLVHAKGARARIRRQAGSLARPRLTPATVATVAHTLLRFTWFALLGLLGEGRSRLGKGASRAARPSSGVRRAQQLVTAGGPAYVKVGQSIATAQGLLPDEWVQAFAWCRDEVSPMSPGDAEQAVAAALGRPLAAVFASFDPAPRAAASIAQVHDAALLDGTEVVVKVQRPGLRLRFGADFRVMAVLAAATTRVSKSARMSNAGEILPLAAELVLAELDFRLEALNMVHVAVAGEAAGLDFVRVPRPIPGLITADVLVMERVPGVPYTIAKARYGDSIDGDKLLTLAATGVLEHALMYGVFHGDLHAGNVLITETGTISLVDYGVCGRIDARERALLVRLLIAAMAQDSRGQILAAAEMGALPAGTDLEAAILELDKYQSLVTEFTDASFDALDLTLITRQMKAVITSLMAFGFKAPKELVLFSRNLLYLNGFATSLAPEANMLAVLEDLLAHMTGKYPGELTHIMMGALIKPTTQG